MVDHLTPRIFLAEVDSDDPHFARKSIVWADQIQREMQDLVAAGKREIASSKALLAEINCMLARR